ncbi:AAA family ATPase [Leeia aquatica]|uniref:AAA family ATPase n=1 Tax=Leeia aquatica TaxID=2725557 RepID=A0A847SFR3_9NEIS|nr:AAA family ATPase [Leeia aquatica]NLR76089.1 AAA family ATPase [Leeia aquatica]
MLHTLAIANYRSLRKLHLPLQPLTLVTGANGSGKSSVYRALRLLADVAQGRIISSLAQEGGLSSTLWAGPEQFSRQMLQGTQEITGVRRNAVVRLLLGFASEDYSYAIDLGFPEPIPTYFGQDPVIKRECIWNGPVYRRASLLVDRHGAHVQLREGKGDWAVSPLRLATHESMLTQLADPRQAPEMLLLREKIRGWRFYDHFRSDSEAPARQPQIGTRTPVLASDGADLAAAMQTILEIGDDAALQAAISDAFPGARIHIDNQQGRFELQMQQHGLLRPLRSAELSDGTLRYLLWVAALLTPRPPELLVLNEPETSLHPDLLPALGRLIIHASQYSQLLVVSHAPRLIATLEREGRCHHLMLEKRLGETLLQEDIDSAAWKWPER